MEVIVTSQPQLQTTPSQPQAPPAQAAPSNPSATTTTTTTSTTTAAASSGTSAAQSPTGTAPAMQQQQQYVAFQQAQLSSIPVAPTMAGSAAMASNTAQLNTERLSPFMRREQEMKQLLDKAECDKEALSRLLVDAARDLEAPRRTLLVLAMADNLRQHRVNREASSTLAAAAVSVSSTAGAGASGTGSLLPSVSSGSALDEAAEQQQGPQQK